MDAIAARIETSLWQDLTAMKQSVQDSEQTVTTLATDKDSILQRLKTFETLHKQQTTTLTSMRLQQDDLENRHRRNNIKIRNLPEVTGSAELPDTVIGIFNDLL